MGIKLKVNIPVKNLTIDTIGAEVELEEQGIAGALTMLIQEKNKLDDAVMANLVTDHVGNVYNGVRSHVVIKEDLKTAALVDAMNALLFGEPRKLDQTKGV